MIIQFENVVKRYNDIILSELKKENIVCWIAGGSIRDYFMGIPIKTDYDIFFPNEENYTKSYNYFKSKNCVVKWESDNGCKVVYNGKTFDLVKKYFKGPQETINEFDFTVSMFAVDTTNVYHGETSFIDLAKRQLMINKITFPASTLSRAFRYYKKGFNMCLGEMKKLYDSIQDSPKQEVSEKNIVTTENVNVTLPKELVEILQQNQSTSKTLNQPNIAEKNVDYVDDDNINDLPSSGEIGGFFMGFD